MRVLPVRTAVGDYKRETRKGTCFTIIGLFVVYLFFAIVSLVFQDRGHLQIRAGLPWKTCVAFYFLWWIVWLIFFLSFFVFALFLRMAIRRKYGIKARSAARAPASTASRTPAAPSWSCGCNRVARASRRASITVTDGH